MSILRLALSSLAACSAVLAQGTCTITKLTPATLGGTFQLGISSAPANATTVTLISTNHGPTPLSIVDPNDPRIADVGIELSALWPYGVTNGAGAQTVSIPVPAIATLNGFVAHLQVVTLPGTQYTIGALSNPVATQLGTLNTATTLPTGLGMARAFGALIPASGNRVLFAAGGSGSLTSSVGLNTSELWNQDRLTSSPGPTLQQARALHVAVTMNDGRTLFIGGVDNTGTALASCEIYNPATNQFSTTGAMATSRVLHSAALLGNGNVLVTGGTATLTDPLAAILGALRTTEIYNPTTGLWTAGPLISTGRVAMGATTLNDGRVLLTGGIQVTTVLGFPTGATSVTTTQIYNPATNAWSSGAAMPNQRAGHQWSQVRLTDGRVLQTGGIQLSATLTTITSNTTAAADLYNPTTNSWVQAPMNVSRSLHSATRLNDGRVLVCGGAQGTLQAPTEIADVEVFQPAGLSWTVLPALPQSRAGHAAFVEGDGGVRILGGQSGGLTLTSVLGLRL